MDTGFTEIPNWPINIAQMNINELLNKAGLFDDEAEETYGPGQGRSGLLQGFLIIVAPLLMTLPAGQPAWNSLGLDWLWAPRRAGLVRNRAHDRCPASGLGLHCPYRCLTQRGAEFLSPFWVIYKEGFWGNWEGCCEAMNPR